MRITSDAIFHCPTDRLAIMLAQLGWPVWRYEFDIGKDDGPTAHSAELPFIFDRKTSGGGYIQDYWAALAWTGDPNGPIRNGIGRPQWDPWDPEMPRQIRFTLAETAMEPGEPRADYCGLRSTD
jgi:para-nitrobenzyl esterase